MEPGSRPRPLVQKKTWRDSLPIDMLLSAVSVLVVAQSSSEIPEGLMNNPVCMYIGVLPRDFRNFSLFTATCKTSPSARSFSAANMQWIQDSSRSNVGNLNNIRREASRHFRNKKKAHLKVKIEDLETNGKINNIRDLYGGINDFKKRYKPRTIYTIVKDEKGDLVADSHSIMAR